MERVQHINLVKRCTSSSRSISCLYVQTGTRRLFRLFLFVLWMPKLSIIVRGPQIISEENWTKSRHPSECDSKLLVVIFTRACGTSLSPGTKTYFFSHTKASRYIHMLLLVDYLSLKQDPSKGFIGQNRWYLSELLRFCASLIGNIMPTVSQEMAEIWVQPQSARQSVHICYRVDNCQLLTNKIIQ